MSVAIVFLTFLIANTMAALVPYANASSESLYRSGYNHGCDDADISDPDDRYINQPEKGPSFHTNEFMRGYNDGYDNCSGNSGSDVGGSTSRSDDNDNDEDNGSTNNENKFKVMVTFLEGEDRNFSDVRLYIQEYPQYGTNPPGGSHIDLNDAFYNDAPYTGVWEDEIVIPSGLIDVGEEFHICMEDTKRDVILACYELENGSESKPERLQIDFNNFP